MELPPEVKHIFASVSSGGGNVDPIVKRHIMAIMEEAGGEFEKQKTQMDFFGNVHTEYQASSLLGRSVTSFGRSATHAATGEALAAMDEAAMAKFQNNLTK